MVKKAVTAHLPQERLVVRRNHLHMSERGGVPLGGPYNTDYSKLGSTTILELCERWSFAAGEYFAAPPALS